MPAPNPRGVVLHIITELGRRHTSGDRRAMAIVDLAAAECMMRQVCMPGIQRTTTAGKIIAACQAGRTGRLPLFAAVNLVHGYALDALRIMDGVTPSTSYGEELDLAA
jgi:hypothetical protein